MPTEQEIEAFVAAFAGHWRTEDGFGRLMHPGATLRVAGAREPYSFAEAERFVRGVKRGIPDIALRVLDWAARGNTVYTEWQMSGTIAGRRATWLSINRNTLDGAKSRAGVSCWDRHALLEQLEPGRAPLDLGAELARLQAKD
jgi:hypothetical protein